MTVVPLSIVAQARQEVQRLGAISSLTIVRLIRAGYSADWINSTTKIWKELHTQHGK